MKRALFYLQLLVLAAWCLCPFLWAFSTSLKPDSQVDPAASVAAAPADPGALHLGLATTASHCFAQHAAS